MVRKYKNLYMKRNLLIIISLMLPSLMLGQGQITRNNNKENSQTPIKKTVVTPSNPTGIVNNHEAIDLGLSVRWASCNLGALEPNGYGSYFVLGDLEAKEKVKFEEAIGEDKSILKGINNISGNPKYDACTALWGDPWRLPSKKECKELVEKCKWEWITQNGVPGAKVTGPNGQSIFLPAAGFLCSTYYNPQFNKEGYYSTSTYNTNNVSLLNFGLNVNGGLYQDCSNGYRKTGANSIRPVTK